eukprot:3465929-Pleurochrysis_carterae.AAC.3
MRVRVVGQQLAPAELKCSHVQSETRKTTSPSEATEVSRRATRGERAGMSPKMASLNRHRCFGHGNGR